MLGFLFKIVLIAALVVGVGYFVMTKRGMAVPTNLSGVNPGALLSQLPLNQVAISGLKNIKAGEVLAQVSGALDSLVTHQSAGEGPVVLGVKVSNDSLGTVVSVLQSLPPEQVQQIKNVLCAPAATN